MEHILNDDILTAALAIYEDDFLASKVEDESFAPSAGFERKMEKLIKSQTNVYYKITRTRARKAAAIAVAAALIIASVMSVGAVRELILSFFVSHESGVDVIEYATEADSSMDIFETQSPRADVLSLLPKGYKLTEDSATAQSALTLYSNGSDYLSIEQFAKEAYTSASDSDFSEIETLSYEGREYIIRTSEDMVMLVWEDGGSVFEEVGFLPKETMLKIAALYGAERE